MPVLASGTTTRISLGVDGTEPTYFYPYALTSDQPSVSASGRYAVFMTDGPLGTAACPGFNDSVISDHTYLRDLATKRLELVSVSPGGCRGRGGATGGSTSSTSISGDGRYVAFVTSEPVDSRYRWDMLTGEQVFVRDRKLKRTVLVSVGVDGKPANGYAEHPSISDDGRFVVFMARATNLVSGDRGDHNRDFPDVYVRDLRTGVTKRVGPKLDSSRFGKWSPSISGDGRTIVLEVADNDLAPHRGSGSVFPVSIQQVYAYDRVTGKLDLVSRSDVGYASDNLAFLGSSTSRAVSRDGRWVVFDTGARNLVADGAVGGWHVYLHDRVNRTTVRVSSGLGGVPGNDGSEAACISPNGRWIAYRSRAANLGDVDVVPNTRPAGATGADIYLYERTTGINRLVSEASDGTPGDRDSIAGCPSDDGTVVFTSTAGTLVAGDRNLQADAFVHRPAR